MNKLFIVSAPSGSGKTRLMREVFGEHEIVSVTTRPPRKNEVHGTDYYFISHDEIIQLKEEEQLVQYFEYESTAYGITLEELNRKLTHNHAYAIVSVEGMKQLMKVVPDAITIFIDTSLDDCIQNMVDRGDQRESIEMRMQTYQTEREFINEYNYIVQNKRGNLDTSLRELKTILDNEQKLL